MRMTESNTVGPLKKVVLALNVLSESDGQRHSGRDIDFEFIYGVGTQGITSFEKDLHAKSPGDCLSLRMDNDNLQDHLEHLFCPLMEAIQDPAPVELRMTVKAVTPASNRDLVSAMAKLAGGCDADCDCGCGC